MLVLLVDGIALFEVLAETGQVEQVVTSGLGSASDRMQGLGVGSEHAQPVRQVGGVIGSGGGADPDRSANESGSELSDELLNRVGIRTEPVGQVSSEPAGVSGPVDRAPGWRSSPRRR